MRRSDRMLTPEKFKEAWDWHTGVKDREDGTEVRLDGWFDVDTLRMLADDIDAVGRYMEEQSEGV